LVLNYAIASNSPSHLAPKGLPGFIAFSTILNVPLGVGVEGLPTTLVPTQKFRLYEITELSVNRMAKEGI
jgi:hypothetical protein